MSIDNSGQMEEDPNDEEYQGQPGSSADHFNPTGKRRKWAAGQSCGDQVYSAAEISYSNSLGGGGSSVSGGGGGNP